jgi:Uma2 family endonuclease
MVRAKEIEPIGPVTFEEFLKFEEDAELKHELVDGFIYPWGETNPAYGLAGASKRHELIIENIRYALRSAARKAGCEIWSSEILVRVSTLRAYYPDLHIGCDPTDDHAIYNRRPCVIFEVLSPKTSRTDRTEKVAFYRSLESLHAYVIVHQQRRVVERHWRDAAGDWQLERLTDGRIQIPCIDAELTLDTVYEGIKHD